MVRSFCSMGSKDKARYIETKLSVDGFSGESMGLSLLSLLDEGEEIVYETRRHWGATLPFLLLGLIFARPTSALSLFLLLPSLFQMKTYEFAVTNKRIIAKWGMMRTRLDSIPLEDIREVTVRENAIGRRIGMGGVAVTPKEGPALHLRNIEDPWAFIHYLRQVRGDV